MRATVISVEENVTEKSRAGSPYTCTKFIYQADPYEGQQRPPTKRNIFEDDPLHDVVLALKEGDYVNIEMVKNGKHYDMVGLSKITKNSKPSSITKINSPSKGIVPIYVEPIYFKDDHPDKAKRIGRSVAVKSSIDMVLGLLAGGVYKKSATPDFLKNEILTSVKFLENYLNAPTNRATKQDEREEKGDAIPAPELPEAPSPGPPPIEQPDDSDTLPF